MSVITLLLQVLINARARQQLLSNKYSKKSRRNKKKTISLYIFIFCVLKKTIKKTSFKKKQKQIKEVIEKKGMTNYVIFLETFTDMAQLYNLSDLVIFPVREMSGKFDVPLVLVEAMACKKSVLVSDIPVLKEFVKDNKTGFIVPKAQPEKLAQKIKEIFQNKEATEKIALEGFEFASGNFDIKKNAKKYEKIYQKIN